MVHVSSIPNSLFCFTNHMQHVYVLRWYVCIRIQKER